MSSDFDVKQTKYRRELRRAINNAFNEEELKLLAFDLAVEYESLPGEGKLSKINELISHIARRGRLEDLVTLINEERPDVDLPELPDAEKQKEDEENLSPFVTFRDYIEKVSRELNKEVLNLDANNNEKRKELEKLTIQAIWTASINEKIKIIEFLYSKSLINTNHPIISLKGANLTELSFRWSNFDNINLNGAVLSGASFTNVVLEKAHLNNADLRGALFDNSNLSDCDFSNSNLADARFIRANLKKAYLKSSILESAIISDANLENSILEGCNLNGSRIEKSSLFKANLKNASCIMSKISKTELVKANFEGVNFTGSEMHRNDFMEANMSEANFEDVLFTSWNNFEKVDLSTTMNLNALWLKEDDISMNYVYLYSMRNPEDRQLHFIPKHMLEFLEDLLEYGERFNGGLFNQETTPPND